MRYTALSDSIAAALGRRTTCDRQGLAGGAMGSARVAHPALVRFRHQHVPSPGRHVRGGGGGRRLAVI